MKKILLLFVLIIFSLALFGCDILFSSFDDHVCVMTEWDTITESTCKTYGEEESFCIICYERNTRIKALLPHTPTYVDHIAPTCEEDGSTAGSYCKNCRVILSGIETLPKLGHTPVIDPAVEMTSDSPGRTEGIHCQTCGYVIKKQMSIFPSDYSSSDKYHGDYAYNYLSSLENGVYMMSFYDEISVAADNFHNSLNDAIFDKNSKNATYYAAEIEFGDNNLSMEDAVAVWCAFYMDHPLYYWMSSVVSYTDTNLYLGVSEEYADGEIRESINAKLYMAVEEYILGLDGDADIYSISLGFHDMLISNADYAYEIDGKTPSSEVWAHNILGVLLEGGGVCSSYAKSFQLLLNYCNIDNIYVTGYAGEPHAWNLVQLDDGEWYWYDLTWDDDPDWTMGIRHNYFCVTDDELVYWNDGSSGRSVRFLDTHYPAQSGRTGIDFVYDLPERADAAYEPIGFSLRDEIIKLDGLSYVMIGYKQLALVEISAVGDVVIPKTVSYSDNEYTVICIGKYDEEHRVITTGPITEYDRLLSKHVDIKSIYIPDSVVFIWSFAFDHIYTLESFTVSSENEVYTSYNGVLFTKNMYTLIKYPIASSLKSYSIPTETVDIAYNAFGDGGNIFYPRYLKTLNIPTTVKRIGTANNGKGFSDDSLGIRGNSSYVSGYIEKLRAMLGSGLKI